MVVARAASGYLINGRKSKDSLIVPVVEVDLIQIDRLDNKQPVAAVDISVRNTVQGELEISIIASPDRLPIQTAA